MKTIIENLWENEKLPIKDAIYFSNGTAFSLTITSYPFPDIQKKEWFDFHKVNEEETTNINTSNIFNLSNGNYCYLGEGSCGSEGFIAYLNNNKVLIWVLYSESSNPFIDMIEYDSENVIVESSALFKLKVNINNPLNIALQD